MSIHTNRLKIKFHIDAIEQDFAFIRFNREGKGNWRGAAQLDSLIGDGYKAHAVMFQYGKFAYAMFRRPVDTYELLSRIRSDEQFDKDSAKEVPPKASRHDADDSICEAWLAQILLNSLSSSRSKYAQYHYCNLTGSLLLVPDAGGRKKGFLDIAKISINSDYLLQSKIVRHRKKVAVLSELKKTTDNARRRALRNALEGPNYVFQASTGSLRRHLFSDGKIDAKSTYIQSGLYRKKATIPFLAFGGIDDFEKSHAGILHFVFENIQKHLSKYMDVELTPLCPDQKIELNNSLLNKPSQLHSKLDGQQIRIIDRVDNDESTDLAKSLRESLKKYVTDKKLITKGKRDKKGALNFRIIHDAAYYEKRESKDEYLPSTNDIQRQHLTVESVATASNAIVKTIIKELLIKRDISSKTLSLFDWNKLKTSNKWTFAACDEKANQFVFMEIMPDGRFEFRKLDGTALFGHQEYLKYMDLISEAKGNEWRTGLYFEGLVASEENDINLIFRSEEISLPDITRVGGIIQEVEAKLPENMQSGEQLAVVLDEFSKEYSGKGSEKLKTFSDELRRIGKQVISKPELKSLIAINLGNPRSKKPKINTKEAKAFRDFLLDKRQIRLKFPQDNQSKDELFDASLNIKYFGETDTEAFYYVGDRRDSVQHSFKDACHIRKIVAVKGSKLVFRQLLPTMDVDFVRTGQSTVIPFPFKYIREYKNFG